MKTQLISGTNNPCRTMALAARVCYSEINPLKEELFDNGREEIYWQWLERACLTKGHYSPLEYCQLTFLCLDVPMPTVVQLRTHRHLSMQVQSMRYTGNRISDMTIPNSDLFYTRKEQMRDREGKYEVLDDLVYNDVVTSSRLAYKKAVEAGTSHEVARDLLPCSYVQNFVLSCNLRELFHLFTMRSPKDAQFEIRELMTLIKMESLKLVPEAIDWFDKHHWGKFKPTF
jgi:thymidylate synthase (FAD)